MTETFYDVLGVAEDASRKEIKRAYRRKVKEWHPDVSDHPNAAERFLKIQRAETVLTDPDERERYDRLGHESYLEWFGDDIDAAREEPPQSARSGSTGPDRDATEADDPAASTAGPTGGAGGTTSPGSTSTGGTSSRTESPTSDRASSADGTTSTSGPGSTGDAASTGGPDGAAGSQSSRRESGGSSGGASGRAGGGSTGSAGGPAASAGSGSRARAGAGSTRSTRAAAAGRAAAGAAVRAEAERRRKEWQAAARGGGGRSGAWSSPRAPGEDLEPARVATGIARKIRSRDAALMGTVLTVVYPVFVYSSVAPYFPLEANALVALITVAVVVYALTEPAVSLVVFGVWSVLAPLGLSFLGQPFLSLTGLFVLTACWVPFSLAVLMTLAMPE